MECSCMNRLRSAFDFAMQIVCGVLWMLADALCMFANKHNHVFYTFKPMTYLYNTYVAPLNVQHLIGTPEKPGVVQRDFIEPLLQRARENEPLRILVVNCGPAYEAVALAEQLGKHKRGVTIVATDYSDVMLADARKNTAGHANISVQLADAMSLPFDNAQFDGVLSIGGIKHYPDPVHGLEEMLRVARPLGVVMVLDLSRNIDYNTRKKYAMSLHVRYNWVLPWMMQIGAHFTPEEDTLKAWVENIRDQRVCESCSYARVEDMPFFQIVATKAPASER